VALRTTRRRRALQAVSAVVCALIITVVASWQPIEAESLPFDRTNPFIWDNDAEHDAFTLPFVLALANSGALNLVGISQSPHPFKTSSENFQTAVTAARSSGWKNIPDATWDLGPYYMTALTAPSSRRIEETEPLNTAPAAMIRDRVLTLGTDSKPVVIGSGGALTTVASAYLMALQDGRGPEFAQKAIVAPAIGLVGLTPFGAEYNASQDEWSLYIVLTRLRVVLAPLDLAMTIGDQQRVWQALREIPVGSTVSYAGIAARIGSPQSVRAVAQACAANAIAVAIPCHRVVRHDGALSGYRWGVERKRTLLERERAENYVEA